MQLAIAEHLKNPNITPEQAQQLQLTYEKHQQDLANQQENMERQRQQNLANKYQQLMKVIDELGRDIRPAYAGSRGAPERLKKGIHSARQIVRECMSETDRISRSDI